MSQRSPPGASESPFDGSFQTRSNLLQSLEHDDFPRLLDATFLREFCDCDRSTYEPLPRRSPRRPRSLPQSPENEASALRAARRSLPYQFPQPQGDSTAEGLQSTEISVGTSERTREGTEPDSGQRDVDAISTGMDAGYHGLLDISLGDSISRTLNEHRYARLLGPVPVPAQEELCRSWIERRLGRELEGDSLANAAITGNVLKALMGSQVSETYADPTAAWYSAKVNVLRFLRIARLKRFKRDDLFDPSDLLFCRNIPRVLRTVGALARKIDPEGFSAVAAELPGVRQHWTQADELNEVWQGDWFIKEIVQTYKSISWRGSFGIVVAGSQGAGKSATVDLIMGRPFMPASHAMSIMLDDNDFDEDEQKIIQEYRNFRAKTWPRQFVERGTPLPADEVCKMYVKVSGVSIQVIELPSMEELFVGFDTYGRAFSRNTGSLSDVLLEIRSDKSDIVLLVEQLNEFPPKRFERSCRKLQRIYGNKVWERTIVILTHGHSLPPDSTTYDEIVECRRNTVLNAVREVSGNPHVLLPIVVVENSTNCPCHPISGQPVLPNGEEFKMSLLSSLQATISKLQGADPMKPSGLKRWWEDYAIMGVVFLLLSRI